MNVYHKKTIISLSVILLIFLGSFLLAYFNLKRGISTFQLGWDASSENKIVMGLSFVAILRALYEIIKIGTEY